MKKPAVTALFGSVSAAAERLSVRALLRMWQRATSHPELVGKSL
jgi:hypothetical protein